jgi:hypothetical protein
MSLRMNLYGWSIDSFIQVLGSKNAAVLAAATARLSECLDEPNLSKGKAWLTTLIETGFPLGRDRQPAPEPAGGGLLAVQTETEVHVFVVHSIARAIARDDYLDLAGESSSWSHPAVGSLHNELAACEFKRSGKCPVEYFTWMWKLSNGSPLFGDDFRTEWSFYSLFTNQELVAIVPVFQAAEQFQRSLPDNLPEDYRAKLRTSLSDGGKQFIGDLIKWFSAIQRAGQDAFILWW